MGLEDYFKKFVKLKFIRNLRYEPHIVETINFIKPEDFISILVFYREINYLKSILLEHLPKEAIFDCNVEKINQCNFKVSMEAIVVFLCRNSSNQEKIEEKISLANSNGTYLFVVDYLLGNKLFNLSLMMSENRAYKDIKENYQDIFEKKYRLLDVIESKKNNILIKKFLL